MATGSAKEIFEEVTSVIESMRRKGYISDLFFSVSVNIPTISSEEFARSAGIRTINTLFGIFFHAGDTSAFLRKRILEDEEARSKLAVIIEGAVEDT